MQADSREMDEVDGIRKSKLHVTKIKWYVSACGDLDNRTIVNGIALIHKERDELFR